MDNRGKLEQLLLHFTKGNISKFAMILGLQQSTVSTWKKRNTLDFAKVKQLFPQVDGNWLLTGEGNMLLPEEGSASVNVQGDHNNLQDVLVNSQTFDKTEDFPTSEDELNLAFLQKENALLKQLLDEKERLIKVLLGGHQPPKM